MSQDNDNLPRWVAYCLAAMWMLLAVGVGILGLLAAFAFFSAKSAPQEASIAGATCAVVVGGYVIARSLDTMTRLLH